MNDHLAPDSVSCRLPIEVCENIIDMLYSQGLDDQVEHSRALHSCALVCRAWRVRSQRNLFYSVVLHGTEAVRRLASVLDNGHHLRDYIHEVLLIGRTLHTTTSPLSLFPVALYGKLPRLVKLLVKHVLEDEDWYPRTSGSETAKPLEHLPLHPRFPVFLSAFTAVTRLVIVDVRFVCFNDLLAMIHALPALEQLWCQEVGCKTFGPLPMYTKQRSVVGGPRARPFAPNLQELELVSSLQRM